MIARTGRVRVGVLAAVLALQTIYFVVLLPRPVAVTADNVRYEVAGWNLATGRGYSLPLSSTDDREVQSWVCDRHPSACAADGTHPTALYPPGYSTFIALIYRVAGRSLVAVVAVQLLLLLAMFVLFESLASHFLDDRGWWFAMAVCAFYPFLARQATLIMSDHLHAALYLFALGALLLMRPGWRRAVAFGALMAAATMVRPYSLLVMPVLWLVPSVRRAARAGWREWLLVGVVFALPFVGWTARNAYWFGRFIPMTTLGMGSSLLHTTLEWEASDYDPRGAALYWRQLGGDPTRRDVSQRLTAEAKRRIAEHPLKFAERMAIHVPKIWISLGTEGAGLSRAWPLLVLYLGGLLVLGVAGAWMVRRDPAWHAILIAIGVYWIFLLPSPPEARRTLPLRLPMLLCASVAVSRWRGRKSSS